MGKRLDEEISSTRKKTEKQFSTEYFFLDALKKKEA